MTKKQNFQTKVLGLKMLKIHYNFRNIHFIPQIFDSDIVKKLLKKFKSRIPQSSPVTALFPKYSIFIYYIILYYIFYANIVYSIISLLRASCLFASCYCPYIGLEMLLEVLSQKFVLWD